MRMKLSKSEIFRSVQGSENIDIFYYSKWPYSPSFLIDLESIDSRIKNVIDMVFLADYYEPTLAILFQSEETWTG